MPLKKKRKNADETPLAETRPDETQPVDAPLTLADVLMRDGVITQEQLWDAYGEHVDADQPLAHILLARGLASEAQITRAYASLYDIPHALLEDMHPDANALALVPAEIAEAYLVLPLSLEPRGDAFLLHLAMVNPWDQEFLVLLQERTGCEAVPRLAGEQDLLLAIARSYPPVYVFAPMTTVVSEDESSNADPDAPTPSRNGYHAHEFENEEETINEIRSAPRLMDILLAQGAISEAQRDELDDARTETGESELELLQARHWVDDEQMARAQAVQNDLPYASLSVWIPTSEAIARVPYALAARYLLLPLSFFHAENESEDAPRLQVAIAHPWDDETRGEIEAQIGCTLEPFLAAELSLLDALDRAYPGTDAVKIDAISLPVEDFLEPILIDSPPIADETEPTPDVAEIADVPEIADVADSETEDEIGAELEENALTEARENETEIEDEAAPEEERDETVYEWLAVEDETPEVDALTLFPFEIAQYYQVLPLARMAASAGEPMRLRVATSVPGDQSVIALIERHLGCRVEPIGADSDALRVAIERAYAVTPTDEMLEPIDKSLNPIDQTLESTHETLELVDELLKPTDEMLEPIDETLALSDKSLESSHETLDQFDKPLEMPDDSLQTKDELLEPHEESSDVLIQSSELYDELSTLEVEASDSHEEQEKEDTELPVVIAGADAAAPAVLENDSDELLPVVGPDAVLAALPNLTPALLPEADLLEGLPTDSTARLGDILVSQGVISPHQLMLVLEEQIVTQQRLGTILVGHQWADEEQITRARSIQFDVPYLNVAEITPEPNALELLPYHVARQYQVLPLSLRAVENEPDGRLVVAMANPWDVEVIDMVQRHARRRVEPFLSSESGLRDALERAYQDAQDDAHHLVMNDSLAQAGAGVVTLTDQTEDIDLNATLQQSDQAPVIRFVNTLLSDAVRRRASDIHIEPRKNDFLLRYRVDGQLQTVRAVPRQFLAPTTSRLKIMAEMDISERRLPLDGRIGLRIDNKNIDMRVSTLPAQYGERIVMRVLDRSAVRLGLEQLEFSTRNEEAFNKLIRQPHGIILVTGPTGSGKTTTLYAALNDLKSPTTNILTVEDPIEYELEGISQTAVNERAGLTFARQLRAILRQDPDVILVGEIRDAETAEIAFRAALTGHLVLSTLHCNEAAGAISRLIDMGIEPFLIASTVIGVVGQRLVRRLCPACRREFTPDARQVALLREMAGRGSDGHDPAPLRLYEPVGCSLCDKVGTRGRLAVHEVLTVNNQIHRLTMESAETGQIRKAAIEAGMIPILTDGLEKAGAGLTTLEDIQRRLGTLSED